MRNAMQCNAASQSLTHSLNHSQSSSSTTQLVNRRYLTQVVVGRNWYGRSPRRAPIPRSLQKIRVPESRETRQMDIAPPRLSRLPRTGLARSDPWLPNGLLRCPCLPPTPGSSRGETDLVCSMCIPIRYCMLAAVLCCTLGD